MFQKSHSAPWHSPNTLPQRLTCCHSGSNGKPRPSEHAIFSDVLTVVTAKASTRYTFDPNCFYRQPLLWACEPVPQWTVAATALSWRPTRSLSSGLHTRQGCQRRLIVFKLACWMPSAKAQTAAESSALCWFTMSLKSPLTVYTAVVMSKRLRTDCSGKKRLALHAPSAYHKLARVNKM